MSQLEQLQQYGELEANSAFAHVVRHPLGDDDALLQQLDMQPEECTTCDLYWLYADQLLFVSLLAEPARRPVVTAHRREQGAEPDASFFVVTADNWLTHGHVERALTALSNWLDDHADTMAALDEQPIVVTHEDLAAARGEPQLDQD